MKNLKTGIFSHLPVYILAIGSILLIGGGGFLFNHMNDHKSMTFVDDLDVNTKKSPDQSINSGVSTAPLGCEATVLLLRHCEKPNPQKITESDDGHCSYLGYERSHHLATLFGSRWPMPYKLYAMTTKRTHHDRPDHNNFRQVETLTPLARKSGLEIKCNYTSHKSSKLANDIFRDLRDGSLCGRSVVVSWKHSRMNEMAVDLGWETAPKKYKGKNFNEIWEIKFVHEPSIHYNNKPQEEGNRNLKKKPEKISADGWAVYGSVVYQNFDPLSYSYISGDYLDGGKKVGGILMKDNLD